jgi:hypothetical protein
MLNYQTINYDQFRRVCSINPFDGIGYGKDDKLKNLTTLILATVLTHKAGEEQKLIESIGNLIVKYSNVSIGSALDELHSASEVEDLDGGHDGLDALCYHLSGDSCEKGIAALQAVLKRFEDMRIEDERQREVMRKGHKV